MPESFQAILDKALADYRVQIGVELDKHPFSNELRGRDSPDHVLKLLEEKANAFKVYREGNRKLINWISPVVQVIHVLSGVLGEAVGFTNRTECVNYLFTIRLSGTIPTSQRNLCWRGCSNHGAYPLTFSAHIFPDLRAPGSRWCQLELRCTG
jgi:hypothetical protein